MKFSAFNVDFSSLSPDPLGSRWPAQAGVKDSYPPKKWLFYHKLSRVAWTRLQIGTDMLLIITSTGDRLFKMIYIDDFEWPWTFPKGVLVNFLHNFALRNAFQKWIEPKWLEIDQDNLHMKFSARNVDFCSLSPDPLDSSRPAHVGVNERYPCRKWLFILCWLV